MILLPKILKEERTKIIIFTVLMVAISIAQVLLWPTFTKMIPALKEMVPKTFSWIVDGLVDDGFVYFLITQQMIKNVGMFGGFLAILLGASAISRELENGTMAHLLAQPISRNRVVLEKYFLGAAALFLPVMLSTVLAAPLAPVIKEKLDILYMAYSGIFSYLVVLNIFSFVFLVGVFVDEQIKTISTGLGFTLVMMLLSIFKETSYLSIYGFMDPEILKPLMRAGIFPMEHALISLALSLACLAASWLGFRRANI